MNLKRWDKVWLKNMPAIVKDVDGNEVTVYVFYNGFWIEDVVNNKYIKPRVENISDHIYHIRKSQFQYD